MSKAKKNSVKAQSGDPFTRWLVVGMVALVVAVGAFFFFTTENKESNASLAALIHSHLSVNLRPLSTLPREMELSSTLAYR